MSKREPINIESVQDILNKNDEIMARVKDMNDQHFTETGRRRRVSTHTYGCQMNEHDSEKLNAMLMEMGYVMTDENADADFIIFNTCCVRENAELRVYGNLGHIKKLKELNPDLKLAVCGCMMQQPHVVEEIKKRYKYVDLVFGTHNLHNFPALLLEVYNSESQVVEVWDSQGEVVEGLPVNRLKSLKGFVNIMYGCNNFCTYCIVPYTRGRERSRKVADIVAEVEAMVQDGTKEVMLLGQNVNSYGKTLDAPTTFADLMEAVAQVDGLERIRFMTSHPKDIDQRLLEVMAQYDNICKSLHLPMQSGSDKILKRMNRHYTKAQYFDIVERARTLMPDIGLTTDLIVGFPGETDADFEDTLKAVDTVQYDSAFTYIYSKRTGTPAATFEDQVPEDVKSNRIQHLIEALKPGIAKRMNSFLGKEVDVLVEGFSKHSKEVLMGKTTQGITVNFEGTPSCIGETVKVRITKPKQYSLYGERA